MESPQSGQDWENPKHELRHLSGPSGPASFTSAVFSHQVTRTSYPIYAVSIVYVVACGVLAGSRHIGDRFQSLVSAGTPSPPKSEVCLSAACLCRQKTDCTEHGSSEVPASGVSGKFEKGPGATASMLVKLVSFSLESECEHMLLACTVSGRVFSIECPHESSFSL